MTNDETIETIKSNWPDGNDHFTKLREALGLAIKALEGTNKDKAIQPLKIANGIFTKLVGECPTCHDSVATGGIKYTRCEKCGQKLNWNENK